MAHEFQYTLFRSQRAMLDAIAAAWMTAGGRNDPETVSGFLREGMTPEAAAAEAIEGFGLAQADDFGERPSHMDSEGYTLADLTEAMARFIAERPDLKNADEEEHR